MLAEIYGNSQCINGHRFALSLRDPHEIHLSCGYFRDLFEGIGNISMREFEAATFK